MPVNDHLKIAATELMKAQDLLKQEVEDLRKQETTTKHRIEQAISLFLNQIRSHEQQLSRINDVDATPVKQTIQSLQVKIADSRKELAETQRQIDNAVRNKESMISALQNQASGLMP